MAAQKPVRPLELIELARNDERADRAQLYERIADLFQIDDADRSENESGLLIEIMRALSAQVDMRLRLALAERLADRADANHDLILLLAHDEIEVACPVIMRSMALTEADLVGIIRECSPSHSMKIAGRPAITAPVSAALVETERHDVARALTRNQTAQIAPQTLERLVEISREDPNLLDALAARSHLPRSLAIRMFSWASAGLKQHIARRYDVEPSVLEAELARAVSSELSKRTVPDTRTAMLNNLVEKLRANGQLKPGFLLKALREGQLDILRIAFARLLEIDQTILDRILDSGDAIKIALATRAAGIDKSAFPSIVGKLCAHGTLDGLAAEQRALVAAALALSPPSLAREELLSG